MIGKAAAFVFALGFVAVFGCSSERKLSHVETRLPSGANSTGDHQISPFRKQMSQAKTLPPSCPTEVRDLLGPISLERVTFPPCSEILETTFQAAHAALTVDEASVVEGLISVQCRLNPREPLPDTLEALMQADHVSRRSLNSLDEEKVSAINSEDTRNRDALRKALIDFRNVATPINQWIRNNGEFVLSEELLEYFDHLAVRDACRMTDQEVDLSYRSLRSLEELARIKPESDPQRLRIERFLSGVHQVLDRKIQEYFR